MLYVKALKLKTRKITKKFSSLYFLLIISPQPPIFRSSPPEMFCKKGVLKNIAKFTGKHLCQNLFLNKIAGLRPATSLKKRSGTGAFL